MLLAEAVGIPDALMPQLGNGNEAGAHSKVHQLLVSRRSRLLAATRRRIAGMGHDKVTIRMVAADCGTTVQTVFNLIGNRRRVLSDAISDHGQALNQVARLWDSYPAQILAFTDSMWWSAVQNPDYMREASFAYAELDRLSHDVIRPAGTRFVRASLADVRGRLRDGIDTNVLAEALNSTIANAVFDWAVEQIDLQLLRRNMVSRTSLLILGALKSSEGERIETWLRDFMAGR